MLDDLGAEPGFPSDFLWGVATAALQIEGTLGDARRGESVWDRFCATSPETGPATACDHVRRFRDDIALMQRLGVRAYRFSLAWPRVMPSGKGKPDREGLAFYHHLIDGLLDAGIEPVATLYHGDLPQALEDRGGWPDRDTALYFSDFAAACAERLADRVTTWITINDPWRCAFPAYHEGTHAPGRRDFAAAWAALHHLLLAHAEATTVLRDVTGGAGRCGITAGMSPVSAASSDPEDENSRRLYDAYVNRSVLDPILCGSYPDEVTEVFGRFLPAPRPGDLDRIHTPLEFLGVNYYTCRRVTARGARGPIPAVVLPPSEDVTGTGLEIHPAGLRDVVARLASEYEVSDILVTENGAAFPEQAAATGRNRDLARIAYLEAHLGELLSAVAGGVPVRGYFHWSLLDGFEGKHGYRAPCGLVAVDREHDFARRPKESFDYYAAVIDTGALP
jgi:beta-glucosidase